MPDDRFNTDHEPYSTRTKIKLHAGAAGLGAITGLLPTAYRAIQGHENTAGDTGREVAVGTVAAGLLPLILNWKSSISGPTGAVKSWDDVYHQLGTVRPKTAAYRKSAQAAGGAGPYVPSAASQRVNNMFPADASTDLITPDVPNAPSRTRYQAIAENQAKRQGRPLADVYADGTNMIDTYAKGMRQGLTTAAGAGAYWAAPAVMGAYYGGRSLVGAAGDYNRSRRIGNQLQGDTLSSAQRTTLEMQQGQHQRAAALGALAAPLYAIPHGKAGVKAVTSLVPRGLHGVLPVTAKKVPLVVGAGKKLVTSVRNKLQATGAGQIINRSSAMPPLNAAGKVVNHHSVQLPAAKSWIRRILKRVGRGAVRVDNTLRLPAAIGADIGASVYGEAPGMAADSYNRKLYASQNPGPRQQ